MFYAAVALALVLFLAREVRQNGALVERAEVAEQRADSITLYALQVDGQRKADSVSHAKERERWARERDEALDRADRAAQRRPALVTRVVEVAGDSAAVVEAVAELEAAHAVEVGWLRQALAVSDSIIGSQRSELVQYAYVNGQLRAALDASRAEATAWERAAKRPRVSPLLAFGGGAALTAGVVAWVMLR